MHIHVVFIFWEESVTDSNELSMNFITISLSSGEFIKKSLDHIGNITKISFSRHMEGKLTENGFSEWV